MASFSTLAEAQASNPPVPPTWIRLEGTTAPGVGPALYKKTTSTPTHSLWFTTAGGTKYELEETRVGLSMALDGVRTSAEAFNAVAAYIATRHGGVMDLESKLWTFAGQCSIIRCDFLTIEARGAQIVFTFNAPIANILVNDATGDEPISSLSSWAASGYRPAASSAQ